MCVYFVIHIHLSPISGDFIRWGSLSSQPPLCRSCCHPASVYQCQSPPFPPTSVYRRGGCPPPVSQRDIHHCTADHVGHCRNCHNLPWRGLPSPRHTDMSWPPSTRWCHCGPSTSRYGFCCVVTSLSVLLKANLPKIFTKFSNQKRQKDILIE